MSLDIVKWINLRPALGRLVTNLPESITKDVFNGNVIGLSAECSRIERGIGEYATASRIKIPVEVLAAYQSYRTTDLFRAVAWEKHLGYRGQIWIKREDLTPSGSHKFNTALAQAYYAKKEGFRGLVTDTGAGQWGLAVAMACNLFDLKCIVFMAGHSYELKSDRRRMMQLAGADVRRSGQEKSDQDVGVTGTLAAAMSDAMSFVRSHNDYCLCQGCMSLYAPMHQSVIGLEVESQMNEMGIRPDILIACAGGGTNLCGFASPWLERAIEDEKVNEGGPKIFAVESASAPALTRGQYCLDSPDALGLGGKQAVYSIGADTILENIGAAGLRYHCKSPLLSFLVHHNFIHAASVNNNEAATAGRDFFRIEGVLPAPESAHALAFMKQIAERDRNGRDTVVINLSGSGLLDINYYSKP
jgi:tryptophan synthase beta chain